MKCLGPTFRCRYLTAWGASAVVHAALLGWLAVQARPVFRLPESAGRSQVEAIVATWVEPQPNEPLDDAELLDARVVVRPDLARVDGREFQPAPSLPEMSLLPPPPSAIESNPRDGAPVTMPTQQSAPEPGPSEASPAVAAPAEERMVEAAQSASRPPAENQPPAEATADAAKVETPPLYKAPPAPQPASAQPQQTPATAPPKPASQPTASTPSAVGSTLDLPRPIRNPPPTYPLTALERRWQGTTELRLTIAPDGRVEAVAVHRSSGFRVLDAAAVRAARQWTFAPASRNGQPVRIVVRLPIRFVLQ